MTFKLGDVVRLKSGGPAMTVATLEPVPARGERGPEVQCTWFGDARGAERPLLHTFPVAALHLVAPAGPASDRCAVLGAHAFRFGQPTCDCGQERAPYP